MVEVIDEGPDPSVVKEVVCRNCGCRLRYTPRDVQSQFVKDYTGDSSEFKWIICPKCAAEVRLK